MKIHSPAIEGECEKLAAEKWHRDNDMFAQVCEFALRNPKACFVPFKCIVKRSLREEYDEDGHITGDALNTCAPMGAPYSVMLRLMG